MNRIFGARAHSVAGPALDLDFTRNDLVVDSRITCSGGANGTRFNSAGLVVAAVCPRIDFDPVTLACKGLLIEEARTNLAGFGRSFDDVSWSKTAVTITPNAAVSVDGTVSMDKLLETATTGNHAVARNISITSGLDYVLSADVLPGGRTKIRLDAMDAAVGAGNFGEFDLATGTAVAFGNAAVWMTLDSVSGIYRCSVKLTAILTTTTASFTVFLMIGNNLSYAGDGTSGVYLDFFQVEQGSFPTSRIATPTSAAVTRSADSAVISGAAFSSFWREDEGTIVFNAALLNTVSQTALSVSNGTATGEVIQINTTSAGQLRASFFSGGVQAAALSLGVTAAATVPFSVALSFGDGLYAACGNAGGGVGGVLTASGVAPNINQLRFFQSGSGGTTLNGYVRRLTYYPRRLTGAELQALTS